MIQEKQCPRCNTVKPASDFYTHDMTKSGLSCYCKRCDQQYRAEKQREKLPEGQKRCIACKEIKSLLEFWKDYRCLDGYSKKCAHCENGQRKTHIEHNRQESKKVCSKCKEEKSLDCFYRDANQTTGYKPKCIDCVKNKVTSQKEPLPPNHKKCTYCDEIKPFSEFHKAKSSGDGHGYECRDCRKNRTQTSKFHPDETVAILPSEKKCSKCQTTKPAHEFTMGMSKSKKYILRSLCRECEKERERKPYSYGVRRHQAIKMYGITPDEYDLMYEQQEGKCAICKQEETATQNGKVLPLAIDHCHSTKKVRGLLCSKCNRALGILNDDIHRVEAMLTYLQKYS